MRTYSTPKNPDIIRAEEELKGLKEQLARLESKGEGPDVMVPTGDMPSTGTQYVRLMRDLKFNETLYELLFSQYQAAKIDEAQDASMIQVVEKAVPPEKKTKPKRSLMVMVALMTGLFVSVALAFILEYLEGAKGEPEFAKRLETLKRSMSFR